MNRSWLDYPQSQVCVLVLFSALCIVAVDRVFIPIWRHFHPGPMARFETSIPKETCARVPALLNPVVTDRGCDLDGRIAEYEAGTEGHPGHVTLASEGGEQHFTFNDTDLWLVVSPMPSVPPAIQPRDKL